MWEELGETAWQMEKIKRYTPINFEPFNICRADNHSTKKGFIHYQRKTQAGTFSTNGSWVFISGSIWVNIPSLEALEMPKSYCFCIRIYLHFVYSTHIVANKNIRTFCDTLFATYDELLIGDLILIHWFHPTNSNTSTVLQCYPSIAQLSQNDYSLMRVIRLTQYLYPLQLVPKNHYPTSTHWYCWYGDRFVPTCGTPQTPWLIAVFQIKKAILGRPQFSDKAHKIVG